MTNKKTKKILHVFGAMERGGAETRTMELYRILDHSKVQFDFLVGKPGTHYYFYEIEKLGGRVFYNPVPPSISVFKSIIGIIRIIRENGPFYAIHAHTSHYEAVILFAAWLAGIKIRIAHARTASDKNSKAIMRKLYFFISSKLINIFATKLVACGTEAGYYLFGKKAIRQKRVTILPNAINFEPYENIVDDKKDIREKLSVPTDAIVIGHVGSFRKVKNHEFLINLFNEFLKVYSNSVLVLAGDGELRQAIEEKVKQLNIQRNVLFLGMRNDIPFIMHGLDIFVLPSFYEGVPGVIVEAQASSIPCVISDTITQDVDVGLGLIKYVSLNKDVSIWINAINEQLKINSVNKERALRLIKEAGYDVESAKNKLLDIYNIKF